MYVDHSKINWRAFLFTVQVWSTSFLWTLDDPEMVAVADSSSNEPTEKAEVRPDEEMLEYLVEVPAEAEDVSML